MDFEYFYSNNTGRKYNTPEEKGEARAAWKLGEILYSGCKDMTAAEVYKAATRHANAFGTIELHNPALFIKAFCRGYAEKRKANQPQY